MPTPEVYVGENFDAQLAHGGWVIQDRSSMRLYAGHGVAVREFPITIRLSRADYLQYIDQVVASVIEIIEDMGNR